MADGSHVSLLKKIAVATTTGKLFLIVFIASFITLQSIHRDVEVRMSPLFKVLAVPGENGYPFQVLTLNEPSCDCTKKGKLSYFIPEDTPKFAYFDRFQISYRVLSHENSTMTIEVTQNDDDGNSSVSRYTATQSKISPISFTFHESSYDYEAVITAFFTAFAVFVTGCILALILYLVKGKSLSKLPEISA